MREIFALAAAVKRGAPKFLFARVKNGVESAEAMSNLEKLETLPPSGSKQLKLLLTKAMQSPDSHTGTIVRKLIGGVVTEHTERDYGPVGSTPRAADLVEEPITADLDPRRVRQLLEFEQRLSAEKGLSRKRYNEALRRVVGTLKTLQREH